MTLLFDLLVINIAAAYLFGDFEGKARFYVFISLSWIASAWISAYYEVYRYTGGFKIAEKVLKQFVMQFVFVVAYNGFFERFAEPHDFVIYGILTFLVITFVKFIIYYGLEYFRARLGGSYRKVILIGEGDEIDALERLFNSKSKLGYRSLKKYSNQSPQEEIEDFVIQHHVEELYVSYCLVQNNQVNDLLLFADNHLKTLKYVPTQKQLLTISSPVEYYEYVPVIPRRQIPLDKTYNRIIKRIFDIVFSVLVIVLILSWLFPIVALLIKLESKGPVFFRQKRTGLNDMEFVCYKFRSMKLNPQSHHQQATREDERVTKIGKFIRRTSIDEFPQFFNVLFGDMSIVGPRPHMIKHTEMYSQKVDRFMLRHLVKPGITGMAQTHGYRGEIECDRDLINRFKYDLFYLENWSVFLDIKIIYLTIYNIFKGEEKAY